MKKLLIAATLGALTSTSAYAAGGTTITGTVNVDAERECVCELSGFGVNNISFVNFDAMGNLGEAAEQSLIELGLFCNLPSDVTFASTNGYLALNTTDANYSSIDGDGGDFSTTAASNFAGGLDYSAAIASLGVVGDTSLLSAGTPVSIGTVPPQNVSGIQVDFNTIPGTLPLIAGDYSDTLVVSITPQAL